MCNHVSCCKTRVMKCDLCNTFVQWNGFYSKYEEASPDYAGEEIEPEKDKYADLNTWCNLFGAKLVNGSTIIFDRFPPFKQGDERAIERMINHLLPDGTDGETWFEYTESRFFTTSIAKIHFTAD